jgi:ABC-type glycerol-3-phosphate transport system substrate-binding protein
MFNSSKHKEETAKFLKFIASPEADNEFPMNISPVKEQSLDARVEAYKLYSPNAYQNVRGWYEAWNTVLAGADQAFADAYLPSAEINKIFIDTFPSWVYEGKSTEAAYNELKALIWDSGLLTNKPT